MKNSGIRKIRRLAHIAALLNTITPILYVIFSCRQLPLAKVLRLIFDKGLPLPILMGLIWLIFDRIFFHMDRSIKPAPGFSLRILAETVFSAQTFSEVLEPLLRDLFDEYCQALGAHRYCKAIFVCIRGYLSFWSAFIAQLPISTAKMAYKIWKATR